MGPTSVLCACFQIARPCDLVAREIIAVTGGRCGHAAVRFAERPGVVFSSMAWGTNIRGQEISGVDWFPDQTDDKLEDGSPGWIVVPIPACQRVLNACVYLRLSLMRWCDDNVGDRYDFLGAEQSGTGGNLDRCDQYFCSKVVSWVLARCGLPDCPPLIAPDGDRFRIGLLPWLLAQGFEPAKC